MTLSSDLNWKKLKMMPIGIKRFLKKYTSAVLTNLTRKFCIPNISKGYPGGGLLLLSQRKQNWKIEISVSLKNFLNKKKE